MDWKTKKSEPLQAADCSRRSQKAAGSGRINRTQLCRLPLTRTLAELGLLATRKRQMWLVVLWDLLRPNPSLFLRLRVRKSSWVPAATMERLQRHRSLRSRARFWLEMVDVDNGFSGDDKSARIAENGNDSKQNVALKKKTMRRMGFEPMDSCEN